MENISAFSKNIPFHRLKIAKKHLLTKQVFYLELEVPSELKYAYRFEAGQYLTFRFGMPEGQFMRDFSMVSSPLEARLSFGIKVHPESATGEFITQRWQVADYVEVSEPRGRFTINSKPAEFRTIIAFATGIGITPILSHIKTILAQEPRTRFYLFYGNRTKSETAFSELLDGLLQQYSPRLEVHYFYTQENVGSHLQAGRLDRHKVNLIINQILHLDDTDEESTIWDSVDEVLICGQGAMIREVANACYDHGIPKKNIHFELFESFDEDIFPIEQDFPLINDISVRFKINGDRYEALLPDNRARILQQLLAKKFPVPYSCKSGICGSCICKLDSGDVELLENEYLTEREVSAGKILACMSVPLSREISLNFDI